MDINNNSAGKENGIKRKTAESEILLKYSAVYSGKYLYLPPNEFKWTKFATLGTSHLFWLIGIYIIYKQQLWNSLILGELTEF